MYAKYIFLTFYMQYNFFRQTIVLEAQRFYFNLNAYFQDKSNTKRFEKDTLKRHFKIVTVSYIYRKMFEFEH